jgi:hypothetical protein
MAVARMAGRVSAVELHTFHHLELGLERLRLLDGEETISPYFVTNATNADNIRVEMEDPSAHAAADVAALLSLEDRCRGSKQFGTLAD